MTGTRPCPFALILAIALQFQLDMFCSFIFRTRYVIQQIYQVCSGFVMSVQYIRAFAENTAADAVRLVNFIPRAENGQKSVHFPHAG